MLIDDLKEKLKSRESDLQAIKTFWANSPFDREFNELTALANQENFWQNPEQAQISKKLQQVKNLHDAYHAIITSHKELNELLELFASDETELKKLEKDINAICREITKFKISLLLSDEQDKANCFMSINSGAGGTESQDWADMLLRMYLRFCEREGLKTSLVDYQGGEEAGIKSATLFITGKNAYGLLKSEQGIHRLVRISPFDTNKRRHTSFAAVSLTPEVPEISITINPDDVRVDTYRAGGAGGQHVNKTDSAVRLTHIPSGIVTQCQNERSQLQNKATAMKMLMAKLVQKQKEEEAAKAASKEKKKIEWGSQIRSYVLHPYKMVKDHRTNTESPQPDLILDGDLMEFIEQYLIWAGTQQ
jgi:peptide chain release factor 2